MLDNEREALKATLQSVFGYQDFRPLQRSVIEGVLDGQSGLVIMPTGMGKSLCYQLPALVRPGLTVVISPLIALMRDQVAAARSKGIAAADIHSGLSGEERNRRYRDLEETRYRLLYVTPERFRKSEFWAALKHNSINLLAVDEAHCISQWGHDFRPDYSRLGDIRNQLGHPVTLALTATATPDVRKDILRQLNLDEKTTPVYMHGIERPNLTIEVKNVVGMDEKIRWIVYLLNQCTGTKIIYFSLISSLQECSQALKKLGVEHLVYHGQLPAGLRQKNQNEFIKSRDSVMLATPAFGLGVDKPDVRLVVHMEIPGSIEAYYQEIGRAGRDGKDSLCVLLYDPDDVSIQLDFIKWANPEPEFIKTVFQQIKRNPLRFQSEGLEFLRSQMNFYNSRDFRVETAVNMLERWGALEKSEDGKQWTVAEEPDEQYLNPELARLRLRRQQEKLLDMVNLAKQEGDYKETIYRYFGVS